MKLRSTLAAIALCALAACATQDFVTTQKRALSAIQTAQQATTGQLVAGSITVDQDKARQAVLKTAYETVRAAQSPAEINAATAAAGVTS